MYRLQRRYLETFVMCLGFTTKYDLMFYMKNMNLRHKMRHE